MPYIEAKFSCKLDEKQVLSLKSGFGKAIECIPGKSETWLMVNIEDGKNMFFKGNNDGDCAYLSVGIFGSASESAYSNLTKELTALVSDITGVSPQRTYITYREVDVWGWNGNNF